MNGLHSCKPGNEPQVGQVKTFVVEQRTGKSGKPWTKIKSASADMGGTPFKITKAEKTDFTDNYGNVSFNLDIEPTDGTESTQSTQVDRGSVRTMSKEDYWRNKDQRDVDAIPRMTRSHSQEMALRYFAMIGGFPEGVKATDALRDMTSWFQRDVGHVPGIESPPEPEGEEAF